MKKHYYKSLSEFYAESRISSCNEMYDRIEKEDDATFMGISLSHIKESKYGYPTGVEKLSRFKDFKVEKDINVKFYNQFDGFDIDIERMMDGMDFLIDTHKKRSLPKTVNISVNIAEGANVNYENMLCKTYATISIIDKLESRGVRCAVYACASFETRTSNKTDELGYFEICAKNHCDSLNISALCTSISPWMFRYWIILRIVDKYRNLQYGVGVPAKLPLDINGIIIENNQCLTKESSNKFIDSIKL